MNKEDEKRLIELLEEVDKIFSSDNPKAHILKLKDIAKELEEIAERE